MVLCVQFHQIRMTGIRASQKEKDLSRLLYRICASGYFSEMPSLCGLEREREREREREKLISPLPRGGRRISSSTFLSRRPFGYYLPIASYGTIFAAKWSSNGGLEAVVSE